MGVYMFSVGAAEWFDTDEVSYGELAAALNEELARRGLPLYDSVPEEASFVRGSGQAFEEKLSRPMDGFWALCEEHFTEPEIEMFCGWGILVPADLEEEVWLPFRPDDSHTSMIAGAPQVLAFAQRLAVLIGLPDEVPEACGSHDLRLWFEAEAPAVAARRPGPWSADMDTAFYVALFLRAAQYSIRRGCPIVYR
jgi:hypothetical protein